MSRARAFLAAVGPDVAAGYGLFAVIGLFAGLASAGGFAQADTTLADLLSGEPLWGLAADGNLRGTALVLLAAATVFIPHAWKHRLAPTAFLAPLFVTAAAFWPLYVQHRRQQQAVQALGELSGALGELAERMSGGPGDPLANLGAPAWVLFAVVLYLAFRSVARLFARAAPGVTSSSA